MNSTADNSSPDGNSTNGEPVAPYQPKLISGKWVILVVGAISLAGSAFGWLWTYDAQRRPRDFWGIHTWKLMGRAEVVRAERLVPEPPSADGKPKPAYYDGLLVVHYDPSEAGRYVIEQTKRVETEPGLSLATQSSSLREALVNHRSYNWDSKGATLQRPVWRYALAFTEKTDEKAAEEAAKDPERPMTNPTATLLFDADCRFVRVPSVDKPVVLQASVAEQFKKFFQAQFVDVPVNAQVAATPTATPSATPPAATATGTGSKNP